MMTQERTVTDLLDEIQRLTRYQAHVELRTFYLTNHTPLDKPTLATFRESDPENLDEERDTPYAVYIKSYGIEELGHTWEAALERTAAKLREEMAR